MIPRWLRRFYYWCRERLAGKPPYTWALDGPLPEGLQLKHGGFFHIAPDGKLTVMAAPEEGTGTYEFSVRVTDADAPDVTAAPLPASDNGHQPK